MQSDLPGLYDGQIQRTLLMDKNARVKTTIWKEIDRQGMG